MSEAPIFGGTWEMSYGELITGGDMALLAFNEDGGWDQVCVFQEHGAEVSDDYNTASVATAELFLRAPRMLEIIQRAARGEDVQAQADGLLGDLHGEWTR